MRNRPSTTRNSSSSAIVVVPDELALELHELDVLTVQLADDAGIPVVGELGQL